MKRMTLAALFALALGLGGCSLTLDLEDECDVNGDCSGGLVCCENLCVEAGSCGGGGGQGGGVPTERPADCNHIYGVPEANIYDDNTVLLGMMMPTTGDLGAVGLAIERAAALAAEEINGSGGPGEGRRFGIIACDTKTDPAVAITNATWLIGQAHVPAIIGPATSTNTIRTFNEVAKAAGVVLISPSATSPEISDLPDDDLLWRTVPSDAIQGLAIVAHVGALNYNKVAVIYRDDAYGTGLFNAIQFPLCDLDACGPDRFLGRRFTADEDGNIDGTAVNDIITELQGFEPDVIVLISFVKAGTTILNNAARNGFATTPIVLADGMRDKEVLMGVGSVELLRSIIGTAAASPDGAVYQVFANAYRAKYGEDPGVYNAQAYDAMYLLALAIGSIGEGEVTGAAIAAGLKRMNRGEKVLARANDWNKGLRTLTEAAGATIDFEGASGPLNFDNTKGEAPGNIEGWYFDIDAMDVSSLGVIYAADGTYTPFDPPHADPMN
ncbi:MAG: ABC transporter substrate-binding protein [Myxococcales bacterium]|nr:ABC transporter substrate-binding protein [Myxococcales bacterium]